MSSIESAMLSNTEKATLLRELADEFGYKLYSKTPTYILIDRRGDYPVTEAEWDAHRGAAVKAISYSWNRSRTLRDFKSRGFSLSFLL
jgi:hypothetical protein